MEKIDIAKVLAMSYVEQEVWCEHPEHGNRDWGQSLEDLAFHLRDEAVKHMFDKPKPYWELAIIKVYTNQFGIVYPRTEFAQKVMWRWWSESAQPIHWILAALKAKEK